MGTHFDEFDANALNSSHDLTLPSRAEHMVLPSHQPDQRFRAMCESLYDGYYEVDLDGFFIHANAALCHIFGLTLDHLRGRHFTEFCSTAEATRLNEVFLSVFQTGVEHSMLEAWMSRSDNTAHCVEISVSRLFDVNNDMTGYYGIVRDITARMAEAHQQENRLQQLTTLEEIKSQLARLLMHDLRNSLTQTLAYVELMVDDLRPYINEKAQSVHDRVLKSIAMSDAMIDDGIALERMFMDRKLSTHLIVLDGLAQRALKEFDSVSAVKQKRFTVDVLIKPHEGVVLGEETLLYRAMSHYVHNAIEYTESGGHITFCVYQEHIEGHDWVVFSIQDTGIGIEESEQARVFQAQPQLSDSEIVGKARSRLGLFLVKEIIEWHKGQVFFESAPNKGSTFGFRLPIAHADAPST